MAPVFVLIFASWAIETLATLISPPFNWMFETKHTKGVLNHPGSGPRAVRLIIVGCSGLARYHAEVVEFRVRPAGEPNVP